MQCIPSSNVTVPTHEVKTTLAGTDNDARHYRGYEGVSSFVT